MVAIPFPRILYNTLNMHIMLSVWVHVTCALSESCMKEDGILSELAYAANLWPLQVLLYKFCFILKGKKPSIDFCGASSVSAFCRFYLAWLEAGKLRAY